jgi:hypothetical protein
LQKTLKAARRFQSRLISAKLTRTGTVLGPQGLDSELWWSAISADLSTYLKPYAAVVVEQRDLDPDPLHAMQFRPLTEPEVRAARAVQLPSRNDRDCPLDAAHDRCLWHAGGTAGENDDART